MIGTRECSDLGGRIANNTARFFASKGFNIVSGLALGIDTVGHRGALEANGYTTAILVDVKKVYPQRLFTCSVEWSITTLDGTRIKHDVVHVDSINIKHFVNMGHNDMGLLVLFDKDKPICKLKSFNLDSPDEWYDKHTLTCSKTGDWVEK